jgi:hypothetical protein
MKNKIFIYILIGIMFINIILPASAIGSSSVNVYSAASTTDLQNIIFNAIKNREEAFKITYTGDTSNIMNDIKQARDCAVIKDPYEETCISLISGYTVSNFPDHADIYFNSFKYYTTKEQEVYVNQRIQEIVAAALDPKMSDNQKEKAIHDYIIKNVKYDNTHTGYTAYSALYNGYTVCNGYVQLAYRLLNAAGIETKIVKGTYNSIDHEWNLVKINNHWYHLDCTLDASLYASSNKPSYNYYNLTDSEIVPGHQYNTGDYPSAVTKYVFLPVSVKQFDDITVSKGSNYTLPAKATVTYEDGSTSEENVSWTPLDTSATGTKTCTGTVNIQSINLTTVIKVTITAGSGNAPSAPGGAVSSSAPELPLPEETVEITKYSKLPQPKNKTWTLKFNQNIDFSTIDSSTAFVVDSSGNVVEGVSFKQGDSSNALVIKCPSSGYMNGKSYCIYILKGVFSKNSKGLTKAIKIPFTIAK